jgi:transposase InsO family protein
MARPGRGGTGSGTRSWKLSLPQLAPHASSDGVFGKDNERRRLISLSITAHPTAEWIAHQITDAFPWDEAPDYLIRDRDASYGSAVTKRLAAMGIRDHPIAPRSPWQNGHAERLIGSIRRECLDHIVVLGEAHLRRILAAYASYYNELRTH